MSAPEKIPDDIMQAARAAFEERVDGMCMTWDHSFGLMSEERREGLRRCFRQLGEHDVIPAIARAIMAERERCANMNRTAGDLLIRKNPDRPAGHLLVALANAMIGEG